MRVLSAIVVHHGIIAGMYNDLGIGTIINEIIPKQGQHKLPHSLVLKFQEGNIIDFAQNLE